MNIASKSIILKNKEREQIEAYIDEVLTYLENEYKQQTLNPKFFIDVLVLSPIVVKYGRKTKLWEKIGYDICKYIKQHLETYGIENTDISMISGFGYWCYAVNEFSKTTGYLKNFSRKLNELLLNITEEKARILLVEKASTKMNNYDCISGLSGTTYYLLETLGDNPKLNNSIEYLIYLSEDGDCRDTKIINYHIPRENQYRDDEKEIFIEGNLNFGLSHGMMGPLLTLSKAYQKGIHINKLKDSVNKLFEIYENFKLYNEGIPFWPGQLPLNEYLEGTANLKWYHLASSWCYGNISIARGLQKVSRDMNWIEKENIYIEDLVKIIQYSKNNYYLVSPSLCHGFSSILSVRLAAYKDTFDLRMLEGINKNFMDMIEKSLENTYYHRQSSTPFFTNEKYTEGVMEDLSLLNGVTGILLTLFNLLEVDNSYEKILMLD